MKLTIQVFINGDWADAATLTIRDKEKGVASPCDLGYELDYALKWAEEAADLSNPVRDLRACSLILPIQLMGQHYQGRWFSFLEDIVPSGAARRILVDYFGISLYPKPQQDIKLLEAGTIAPVGNLRIKEALPDRIEGSTLDIRRYPMTDVIERNTEFLEYARQMGAVSGGATGAAGEAPKLLLRLSDDRTVWIDTYQESHDCSDRFYLVKFPRGRRSNDDCDILRAEYHFYHELHDMGIETIDIEDMRLEEGSNYPSLWLPRFDVEFQENHWNRFGLESIASALGEVAGRELNHFTVLHRLCELLASVSSEFDQEKFVCEWVKRDLLNIAFGNSDNHGRNESLLKKEDGIWLAPIYDFAPMKADPEDVIRSMLWGSPYEEGGNYRWDMIIERLGVLCSPEIIKNELSVTAQKLVGLKKRLKNRGVPENILNKPNMGFNSLDQKLEDWGLL